MGFSPLPDVTQKKPIKKVDSGSADMAIFHAMKKQYTAEQVIELMRKRQGDRTQREFARELGITQQYLCDLYLRRRNPGEAVLRNLGLSSRVVYEVA